MVNRTRTTACTGARYKKLATPKALFYLLPGLGDILWIAAFIGVIGLGPRMLNTDGDLGRHITIGKYILEQGRVPTADLFSHTMAGQPLTPHEWLSQVLFALANTLHGLDGVVLLCGLVIATAFWLVYRRARTSGQGVLAAVIAVILAMAASSLHWLARPHIFTFLFLALWMVVLESMRCGRLDRWWLMPLLMLPWANLHGAFIAGFATWILFGLGLAWDGLWRRFPKGEGLHGHFWRYYLMGGGSALLVTLLNPSGIGLWKTSIGYIGSRYLVSHTAEYLSPNFQDPSTWPFLLIIGLLVVALGLQARRMEGAHVIPAAAWLVMGLYSVRNVPLFAIVSAPLIAQVLGDWLSAYHFRFRFVSALHSLDQRLRQTDLSLRGVTWPVVTVLAVALLLVSGSTLSFQYAGVSGNQFDPAVFPVTAVDWLKENPQPGEMFNYFPWGGYLLYRAWPEQRVFIDGQTDFYGEALTRQYEQILTVSAGWEGVLDQYNVKWVIFPPGEPLTGVLRTRQGWKQVYEDGTAVIFTRQPR